MPGCSVIIATYNRAALLQDCLAYLAAQRFHEGDEVIVVDNASTDDTAATVRSHQCTWPVPLRLLHEPQPGKSHALARALSTARGDVLAFLDDDVTVAADWLDVLRRVMSDGSVSMMGGRVVPRWDAGVPAWMRNAPMRHARLGAPLGLLEYGPEVVELGCRTVLGANMAVRRCVFERVGGFATHLGKFRGTLLSGEDHELCLRVQRAGFRAVYVPQAVVHHSVPATRTRVSYFLHWFFWSGITHAMLDDVAAEAERLGSADALQPGAASPWFQRAARRRRERTVFGVPAYLARRGVVATLRTAKALMLARRTDALNSAIDGAFAAGYAAHRWGLHTRQPAASKQITPEAA